MCQEKRQFYRDEQHFLLKEQELGNYNKLILDKLAEADKDVRGDGIEAISENDYQICIALARVF